MKASSGVSFSTKFKWWQTRSTFFLLFLREVLRVIGTPKLYFSTAVKVLKNEGLGGLFTATSAVLSAHFRNLKSTSTRDYSFWLHENRSIFEARTFRLMDQVSSTSKEALPLVSVLMPVYRPNLAYLEAAIESLQKQVYSNWELCICDDGTNDEETKAFLLQVSKLDSRIRLKIEIENKHISHATNIAAELASGDYFAFMDQDDLLDPAALLEIAAAILDTPGLRFIYSDEDKINEQGLRFDPHFKPSNPFEISRTYNVYSHLTVIRADLFRELGGLRLGYEGAQDWDLALRATDAIAHLGDLGVKHIPRILYHWRVTNSSTAGGSANKPYALEAGLKAVKDHLGRLQVTASVQENPLLPLTCKVLYSLPKVQPEVAIIIPTRDALQVLKPCVESVLEKTSYENYKIIIMDNGSVQKQTFDFFNSLPRAKVSIIRDESVFNYSALNNEAVAKTDADFICLLNNDIEIISPNWLEELVSLAIQDGAGAAGPMLWYPDQTIQHAGVVLGIGGQMSVAGHWQKRSRRGSSGYMGRLSLRQNFSAVTGACLVVRRDLFLKVGGLDEKLRVAFNDVDLCLKIQELGYRNIWTPFVDMIHHESVSRGPEDNPDKIARAIQEVLMMRNRWSTLITNDPCYNPNLSVWSEDFGFACPPRIN